MVVLITVLCIIYQFKMSVLYPHFMYLILQTCDEFVCIHIIIVLPHKVAHGQAFIGFQHFVVLATKQDMHLLVADSCDVYNL